MTEKQIEYYELLRTEVTRFPEALFPGTVDRTLRVAADAGYLPAIADMVRYLMNDDPSAAIDYARKGAERGDKRCQYYLRQLLYGSNVEEALKRLTESAEQGSARAACLLGQVYQSGEGVPCDREKAIFWYRMSILAEADYCDRREQERAKKALIKMGESIYEDYMGEVKKVNVPEDLSVEELYRLYRDEVVIPRCNLPPEAFACLIAAAEKGYPLAQESLSGCYIDSDARNVGIYNEELANEWYFKAIAGYKKLAEQGDTDSMSRLGKIYIKGNAFVCKDNDLAMSYFRMGAEKGDCRSQYYLGEIYYDEGRYAEALPWLEKSGEQGELTDTWAISIVAYMYEEGLGTPVDIEKAIEWNKRGVAAHYRHVESTSRYSYFCREVERLESQYGTDINKDK